MPETALLVWKTRPNDFNRGSMSDSYRVFKGNRCFETSDEPSERGHNLFVLTPNYDYFHCHAIGIIRRGRNLGPNLDRVFAFNKFLLHGLPPFFGWILT
jgi:hypothetical protein